MANDTKPEQGHGNGKGPPEGKGPPDHRGPPEDRGPPEGRPVRPHRSSAVYVPTMARKA